MFPSYVLADNIGSFQIVPKNGFAQNLVMIGFMKMNTEKLFLLIIK
jgi:hypothetical protein